MTIKIDKPIKKETTTFEIGELDAGTMCILVADYNENLAEVIDHLFILTDESGTFDIGVDSKSSERFCVSLCGGLFTYRKDTEVMIITGRLTDLERQ